MAIPEMVVRGAKAIARCRVRADKRLRPGEDDEYLERLIENVWPGYVEDARAVIEVTIKECASVAKEACLVAPDDGSPTEDECLVCEEAERRILTLLL